MDQNKTTRLFAYLGLAMIIVSLIIAVWVGLENRALEKKTIEDEDDLEEYADGEKRIAFFYNRNIEPGFFADFDRLYPLNPVPGYTGFGFFLVMGGIAFAFYAFYNALDKSEGTENIAKLGLLIVVISLILAAWVGYTQYRITDEHYQDDPDEGDQEDMFKSTIIVYYVNSTLVFLGPAFIFLSVFKEKVPTPGKLEKYLFLAGFIILMAAIALALVSGIYAKQLGETWMDVQANEATMSDINDLRDGFKTKAFMAQFYPYLSYLGLGLMLFPFAFSYTKERFAETKAPIMTIIGLICVVAGVALAVYPAIQYNNVAQEFDDMFESTDGDEGFEDAMKDYYTSTAFCYFATAIIVLGLGLMLFTVTFGHYLETAEFSQVQVQGVLFLVILVVGLVLGVYAGILRNGSDFGEATGDEVGFFTVDYLFMMLLFAATGLMFFNWSQHADLFTSIRYLCPDCGEEVRFLAYYDAWYCDSCEETTNEPVREEVKSCPDCGEALDYIRDYDRWYCDYCEDYKRVEEATRKKKARKKKRPAGAHRPAPPGAQQRKTPRCRECGGPMTYIPQYERWYCYSCGRYGGAPRTRQQGAGGIPGQRQGAARSPGGRPSGRIPPAFRCPGCGKVARITTDRRPLKLKCSGCGTMSVLRK